jgi:hypothetical protein
MVESKSQSPISYRGEVTLKIMHGDKVVKTIKQHNEGTIYLMRFLAHCLGDYYVKGDSPKYIRLFDLSGTNATIDTTTEVTSRAIVTNFNAIFDEDSSTKSGSVTLTFLVPSTLVRDSKEFDAVAIYGTSQNQSIANYMAWVKFDDAMSISQGESLMLLWKMTLSNKTE